MRACLGAVRFASDLSRLARRMIYRCKITRPVCMSEESRKVFMHVAGNPSVTCFRRATLWLVGRHHRALLGSASHAHTLSYLNPAMLARRILRPCATAQRGTRAVHSTVPSLAVLGLRAEDPARRWERRAALDPDAVRQLVQDGHNVLVEQCSKRAIREEEYKEVSPMEVFFIFGNHPDQLPTSKPLAHSASHFPRM